MLGLNEEKQPDFSNPDFDTIITADDNDIEIQKVHSETRKSVLTEGLLFVRDLLLVFAFFILFGVFIAQPVVVEGTSMLPNLHEGERLIVDKLIYYKFKSFSAGHIERGDVVVFWYPVNPDQSFVKRVIGLPGETVEIRNGKVFVSEKQISEPYLDPANTASMGNMNSTPVTSGHYFVMGDNRDNSSDSRVWGLVPEKYIYGKVFFRYWSPTNIGVIRKGDTQFLNEMNKSTDSSSDPNANTSSE
jgi:signal peptidase I